MREPDNNLTDLAPRAGVPRHVAAYADFGLSLVALDAAIALYHALISMLIAGSDTPFCLAALRGRAAGPGSARSGSARRGAAARARPARGAGPA